MRNEILSETSFIITDERFFAIYLTHDIITKRATSTNSYLKAKNELDIHFLFFTKLNIKHQASDIFILCLASSTICMANSLLWNLMNQQIQHHANDFGKLKSMKFFVCIWNVCISESTLSLVIILMYLQKQTIHPTVSLLQFNIRLVNDGKVSFESKWKSSYRVVN